MFLNMDNSRNINDAMGHAVGDRVICEIGRRIDEMAGDEHLVAHLGGTVGELLRVVDAAVHHATRRGGAVHQFYSSEISVPRSGEWIWNVVCAAPSRKTN